MTESFKVLNDWARALRDWETRIRAMCGILEVKFDLEPGQFGRVVASVKAGKHAKADIQDALKSESGNPSPVGGASDVVGHPPDPPFRDLGG